MAQHDYVIANGTGAAVRSDINGALAAIVSQNSGATTPATTYAYQFWADTTTGLLKIRNAANSAWITLFQLDGEWSTLAMENGTAAAPSIYFKDSGTDTGFYSPGADQVGISTGGVVRLTTSTTAFTGTLPWLGQNGTAAAPALSFSGDPNTGIYNVGADNIGVSTNGTLRFDVSTTAVTSTLPVVHPLGAVATPSVTFTGDLNTGIWSPAADTIAFSEGGAEVMRIDSSSRLLIGATSTISTKYDTSAFDPIFQAATTAGTSGFYRYGANTDGSALVLSKSRNATIGSHTIVNADDTVGYLGFAGSDGAAFITAATIRAAVDGTPGTNDMPGRLIFSTTADGAATPTERCRIDSSGRLLVGTSTARSNFFNTTLSARFQVEGANHNDASVSIVRNENGATPWLVFGSTRGTTVGSTTALLNGDGCGGISFQGSDGTEFVDAARINCEVDGTPGANDMPGRLSFQTTGDGASSPTEKMRLDSNGYLWLRQFSGTSPWDATSGTYVKFGDIYPIGATAQSNIAAIFNRNTTTGSLIETKYNGAVVGSISVTTTTTAYNTSSDYRLKENISAVADGITRLQQLKPSRFNFIVDPDRTVDGFIAHEVQAVVPEAITGEKDAVDDDGNPVYQGIDQSKLVPLLTAALQEAVAKIESLEARLTAAGI